MNIDLETQHELIKNALEATDGYLAVLGAAKGAGIATAPMIHEFSIQLSRAHDALQRLGVLDQHEDYMRKHVGTMMKLSNHDDSTMADLPYAHTPAADLEETDEEVTISFADFISEQHDISEQEINKMVNDLKWEDIKDLYEDEEEEEEEDEENVNEEVLDEKLSPQARIKMKLRFLRTEPKRGAARDIKLKRSSSLPVLKKRATLAAKRSLYKRFLKGRDKNQLSAAEKDQVEAQVSRLKNVQAALAMRMLPKIRSIEKKRLTSKKKKK